MKSIEDPVVTSVEPVPGAGVVAGATDVTGTKGQAVTEVTELLT